MITKNKSTILISAIILILLLGGFLTINKDTRVENISSIENKQEEKIITKNYILNSPEGNLFLDINGEQYSSYINSPISVENFMLSLKERGEIDYTYKTYSGMGKFIDSINGIKNADGNYWIFYVNGKEADTGISNYLLNPSDVVSWKYKKEL